MLIAREPAAEEAGGGGDATGGGLQATRLCPRRSLTSRSLPHSHARAGAKYRAQAPAAVEHRRRSDDEGKDRPPLSISLCSLPDSQKLVICASFWTLSCLPHAVSNKPSLSCPPRSILRGLLQIYISRLELVKSTLALSRQIPSAPRVPETSLALVLLRLCRLRRLGTGPWPAPTRSSSHSPSPRHRHGLDSTTRKPPNPLARSTMSASQPLSSDTSPAPSSSSSAPTLPREQCLTPPSVRRREARLARCAIVASNSRGSGAEAESAGDAGTRERPRTEYGAEEVEARRVGRRQAEREGWRGWEVEAEGYDGQRWDEGVVRADGTVDWARLEGGTIGGEALEAGHDVPALPTAADPLFLRDSLGAQPATLPPAPTTIARLGLDSLPPNTLPLLLSALYIAFRALYPSSRTHRRSRSAGQSGAEGKVWMGSRESRE
ncbi:hypothetical protein AAT19DRAFT_11540 [Rhodotorula toruloides]|uniref:Uncharacterized protein n=2 Tax=Rhodotorula toruloides TaxID=5286 RepID=A0A2S9ZVV8_RHOTO|nr:hypothetical protein AAT19DRAFT_11540 [Rhodotorula toruloides]